MTGLPRLAVAAIVMLTAQPCRAATVQPETGLFGARAYVTGTRPETRTEAIASAFRKVLVKVSGNPALADDPRVEALQTLAAGLVEDIVYIDRMSDEPHHDEQGTRDRPFDLTVRFDPAKIDAALRLLGDTPYTQRSHVLVRIEVDDHGATYKLTADAEADERQREALIAAADQFGLRVILTPLQGDPPLLRSDTVILSGTLAWSEPAFGWVGAWHLEGAGKPRYWRVEGVSFDDAYRNAMSGVVAILTGH